MGLRQFRSLVIMDKSSFLERFQAHLETFEGKRKHIDNSKLLLTKVQRDLLEVWKKPGLEKDCKGGKLATKPMVQAQMVRMMILRGGLTQVVNCYVIAGSRLWLDHVHFKRMQDMSKDGLIPAFDMDTEKCNCHTPS
ncbi:hypothetical protein Tco_0164417 [Tanacetum coccineum]